MQQFQPLKKGGTMYIVSVIEYGVLKYWAGNDSAAPRCVKSEKEAVRMDRATAAAVRVYLMRTALSDVCVVPIRDRYIQVSTDFGYLYYYGRDEKAWLFASMKSKAKLLTSIEAQEIVIHWDSDHLSIRHI